MSDTQALIREAQAPHFHSADAAASGVPCHGGCIQGRLVEALAVAEAKIATLRAIAERAPCECYDEPTLVATDHPRVVECARCAALASGEGAP